ncbi:hypothetical protein EYF80_007036 [Liparis tanakae]|uniref:Uncharacterized protein n=1 Tax=Liparis tanakae TaxID=230148 RepID=A0A4Z2IXU0_9TELE|nr:hypothetical protein EYF80_007036 [Liparis tanakae]
MRKGDQGPPPVRNGVADGADEQIRGQDDVTESSRSPQVSGWLDQLGLWQHIERDQHYSRKRLALAAHHSLSSYNCGQRAKEGTASYGMWSEVFNVYFSVVKFCLSSHIWLFRLVSSQLIEQLIDARCRQRAWQPQRAVQPRHTPGRSQPVAEGAVQSCECHGSSRKKVERKGDTISKTCKGRSDDTVERDGARAASVSVQMTEWMLGKQREWGEEWGTYCEWSKGERKVWSPASKHVPIVEIALYNKPDIAYTQSSKQRKSYCLLKRLSHSASYCRYQQALIGASC